MTMPAQRPRLPRSARTERWLTRALGVLSVVTIATAGVISAWQAPATKPAGWPADADPVEEAFIQTPGGFEQPGLPKTTSGDKTGTIKLSIVDRASGKPTFARVNVVGADGNYYEPAENPLAKWSLHRTGNRLGKGPIRYYGWFFYSSGEAAITVPAGPFRVEVWKGLEYRPVQRSGYVAASATRETTVTLDRTVNMEAEHYFSGDTHIHLERSSVDDDERALDLLEAEDVRNGCLLCMNEINTYTGKMNQQLIPQERGFGPESIKRRGDFSIVSGQEYRASTFGHICLLMHRQMVQEGRTVAAQNWPVFGMIGEETRALGGVSLHAHGGYAQEIYVDFAQRATDGVELLQFAEYRGIGLEGWYHILNIGYRFPAVGASDYPYCRALADCRTYVYAPTRPNPAEWARLAATGRSFFTTGPLVLLEVDGQTPGTTIRKTGNGPISVRARIRAVCNVAPIARLDLIVNGEVVRRIEVPRSAGAGNWIELDEQLALDRSSWIAARASSTGPTAKADAEAHTNPVYIDLNGRAAYAVDDLDWLVARIDDQIAQTEKRSFEEKPRVLDYFRKSRSQLLDVRAAGGIPSESSKSQ